MNVEDSSTFWIGLDDTDEREHGCTTYDFNDLLNTLTSNLIFKLVMLDWFAYGHLRHSEHVVMLLLQLGTV